jgi:hypothetical protein
MLATKSLTRSTSGSNHARSAFEYIGVILLLFMASCPSSAATDSADAKFQSLVENLSRGSLLRVDSVTPVVLHADLTGSGSDYAATIVEVRNAHDACAVMTCIKLFESRRTKLLADGMRAVVIFNETKGAPTARDRPVLLWGSRSILVLQSERTKAEVANAWRVVQAASKLNGKSLPGFELDTEAAHGVITKGDHGFTWTDSSD